MKKDCAELQTYVDYWDGWHKNWRQTQKTILDWPMPFSNYFPEPYWGNPFPQRLTAVFLNLNPGGGNDDQNVLLYNVAPTDPFKTYQKRSEVYSNTVSDLIKIPTYPTTEWFIDRRVKWLNDLVICLSKIKLAPTTIDNILCADLVPWHTSSGGEIAGYIRSNYPIIVKHVIDPIIAISQYAELKGLVFAKGAEIAHLFSEFLGLIPTKYTNGDYSVFIYNYKNATVIVLVGGQGMRLPKPSNVYMDSNGSKLTVCEIVNGCIISAKEIV